MHTEQLLTRALAIREARLEKSDPAIGRSLNSLAALYQYTGRYAEAEALYERALAIIKESRGAEHPDRNALHAVLYEGAAVADRAVKRLAPRSELARSTCSRNSVDLAAWSGCETGIALF